jgi:hypothetical protein
MPSRSGGSGSPARAPHDRVLSAPRPHPGSDEPSEGPPTDCGSSVDRARSIFEEMPEVPFKSEVWPKFLRANAAGILRLGDHLLTGARMRRDQ